MEEFSISKIYDLSLETLKNIYNSFKFLNISETNFKRIAIEEIVDNKEHYYDDKSYILLIKNKVVERLSKITKVLLNDDKFVFKIIDYILAIKKSDINDSKYLYCKKRLQLLGDFFNTFDYIPGEELIEIMLKKTILKDVVRVYVHNNLDRIKAGKIEDLFDNQTLILIINNYCIMHNIEIKEDVDYDFGDIKDLDLNRVFINDAMQIPLLTKEEELELGRRIQNGDLEAKKTLVESNILFVISVAKHYLGRGVSLMDLVQEGCIGLMCAASKYDYSKGFAFTTFAGYEVRQKMSRLLARQNAVKVSYNMGEKLTSYKKKLRVLSQQLGHDLTDYDIAEHLNMSLEEVHLCNTLVNGYVSLNKVIGEEEGIELGNYLLADDISVEEAAIINSLNDDLKISFRDAKLTKQEVNVLIKRFGLDGNNISTLEELGTAYGVCRERIRQVEENAIRKIRTTPKAYVPLAEYANNPTKTIEKLHQFSEEYFTKKPRVKKRRVKQKTLYPEEYY